MDTNTEVTKVIFRKFPDGEVIALFPEIAANNEATLCESYMHVGQHGGASPGLVDTTRLAKESEYKDLKTELERIGYKLKVYRRIQPTMRDTLHSQRLRLK